MVLSIEAKQQGAGPVGGLYRQRPRAHRHRCGRVGAAAASSSGPARSCSPPSTAKARARASTSRWCSAVADAVPCRSSPAAATASADTCVEVVRTAGADAVAFADALHYSARRCRHSRMRAQRRHRREDAHERHGHGRRLRHRQPLQRARARSSLRRRGRAELAMPADIEAAERLILPGVGAFEDGMRGLRERGPGRSHARYARGGRPLLGICLGMQMLASSATSSAPTPVSASSRAAWFPSRPRRSTAATHKIPHIGWSALRRSNGARWADAAGGTTAPGTAVYLVHSFHAPSWRIHTTNWLCAITVATPLRRPSGTAPSAAASSTPRRAVLKGCECWRPSFQAARGRAPRYGGPRPAIRRDLCDGKRAGRRRPLPAAAGAHARH